jgi:hypothetical protein
VPPAKILRVARKYSEKAPHSAAVWLARLDVERAHAEQIEVDAAWAAARNAASGEDADVDAVWTWGLGSLGGTGASTDAVLLEVRATPLSIPGSHAWPLACFVYHVHRAAGDRRRTAIVAVPLDDGGVHTAVRADRASRKALPSMHAPFSGLSCAFSAGGLDSVLGAYSGLSGDTFIN